VSAAKFVGLPTFQVTALIKMDCGADGRALMDALTAAFDMPFSLIFNFYLLIVFLKQPLFFC
jgi:hypothetical protein